MTRQHRLILVSMCLSLAAVVSAVSSLNVALPDLARRPGATTTQLQWIVDAYALVFAGLLLPAGALGDRFGRSGVAARRPRRLRRRRSAPRRSLTPDALIAVRAVMGVGAALIMPTTLSIITATFAAERARQARSASGPASRAAAHARPARLRRPAGGFAWPSVFALNVVLAAVGFVDDLEFVPAGAPEHARGWTAVGAVLSALGLAAVVWAFIEGPTRGWTSATVAGGFVAGVVLLAAFVVWELRAREPLLDPRLFALRGFAAGSLSVFVQFFALFGSIFVVLQYLQFVLRYSPLRPAPRWRLALAMIALAPRVPRLAQRVGHATRRARSGCC